MTDEEILALWAITADEVAHANSKDGADRSYREDCRIAFARAVAAQERERCAKVCDELHHKWRWDDSDDSDSGPRDCASAIRALGDDA